jgi:glycosyltransferase involved in cell wall biosynthesis
MRVLVNIPGKGKPGGVLSHYEGMKPYLLKHSYYFYSNGNYRNKLLNVCIFPFEVFRFILILNVKKLDVVIVNPSLYPGVFLRDSFYLAIAKLFNKKGIVFFHGWYEFYQKRINSKLFQRLYGKADSFFVLSTKSKECLNDWGIKEKVFLTTTKVDDSLLAGFDISLKSIVVTNILFLSRIEEYKGIYVAIETFKILKKKYPSLFFTIVGDGAELEAVRKVIEQSKHQDIFIKGFLTGKALAREYSNADIYIFPSYNEGLPATILEAMAFGLPIISSNVGGHRDFFVKSMGRIISTFDPNDYAKAIEEYIQDNKLLRDTVSFNHTFASKRFLASRVAADFEDFISES